MSVKFRKRGGRVWKRDFRDNTTLEEAREGSIADNSLICQVPNLTTEKTNYFCN